MINVKRQKNGEKKGTWDYCKDHEQCHKMKGLLENRKWNNKDNEITGEHDKFVD